MTQRFSHVNFEVGFSVRFEKIFLRGKYGYGSEELILCREHNYFIMFVNVNCISLNDESLTKSPLI